MNWSFLLLQILLLLGLCSITIAALYYVRHRHTTAVIQKNASVTQITDDGGSYLKRYIPPEQRNLTATKKQHSIFANRGLFYFSCTFIPLVFFGLIGINYGENRFNYLPSINVSDNEIQALEKTSHNFVNTVGLYAPEISQATNNIDLTTSFTLFKSNQGNSHATDQAWATFLQTNNIRYKTCSYTNWPNCILNESSVAIVSLALTPNEMLDGIIAKKANIWSHGFPNNIENSSQVLPGLQFTNISGTFASEIALVGDRELTLGIDAGLHFPLTGQSENIRVKSDNPQAISMYSDGKAGGDRNVRIHASVEKQSKIVWMDFSMTDIENIGEQVKPKIEPLFANILRYLTHQEYTSIASWPHGKQYGAFMEQDTEEGYQQATKVAEYFEENNYPISWFALSNLSEKHRGISLSLAKTGEMACHGDNHEIFTRYSLEDQMTRLARCIKVIETLTGSRPEGFRPPTEAYNNDTLSAALNTGIRYVFTENWNNTSVPHLKISLQSGQSLVSLPRVISDDYHLWHELKLNIEQSVNRMFNELDWVKTTGAIFGFSFHTQFMQDEQNFAVVRALAQRINTDSSSWVSNTADIANWWRFRHDLITGDATNKDLFNRYKPVTLKVDSKGKLHRWNTQLLTNNDRVLASVSRADILSGETQNPMQKNQTEINNEQGNILSQ